MPRQIVRDFGTALRFNGTTNIVSTVSSTLFTPANNYTVATYIRLSSYTGLGMTFAGTNNYGLRMNNGKQLLFTTFGVKDYIDSSGFRMQLNTDYHYVVTLDSANAASFYINGVLKSSITGTAGGSVTASIFSFGARASSSEFVSGIQDNVQLFNTALTSTQIASLYFTGVNPTTPIAQFLLNEGTGTTALDSSGNSNNGTITGATYTSDVNAKLRLVSSPARQTATGRQIATGRITA